MSMEDQGLLYEPPLPVDLRPSQGTRVRSTRGLDEKRSPAASPMDVDDVLSEILLRLAPLPSSLPRASLVCTRWRRLLTDPGFLRRFRARHWKHLGVFFGRGQDLSFSFFLGARGPELFSVRAPRQRHEGGRSDRAWELSGCRHGRAVLVNFSGYGSAGTHQILVWNPVTGEDHLLEVPQFSDSNTSNLCKWRMQVAVICASGHRGPFKLALAWSAWNDGSGSAHIGVYSSENRAWGNVASAAVGSGFSFGRGNVMAGNTLYWLLFGNRATSIIEFDLDTQVLSVIEVPPAAIDYENHRGIFLCTLAKGGGLSLMVMSEDLRGRLWVWEKTAAGVFQWMFGGTIELDLLLSLRSEGHRSVLWLEGDDNVMFVSTYKGIFMVHLQSMQFEKIFETGPDSHWSIHPFKYLHAQGGRVQGSGQGHGEDGADRQVLHVSIKGGAQAAGLKLANAHVSWEGGGPTW